MIELMANMKNFNGESGCSTSHQKEETVLQLFYI